MSSPSPSSRKRERSPTPSSPSSSYKKNSSDSDSDDDSRKRRRRSSGSDELSVEVCKDFTRNGCRRAEVDCKFAHPHSAVSIRHDKVTACVDSLRNKCFRGRTCRYYHPPPHIQQSLLKAIGVEDPKLETVCKDFMRGRCFRAAKDCRFAHHSSVDQHAVVCQDFIRGRCERKSCRYSHVLGREMPEVCQDFVRGRCERKSCRFSHVLVPEIPQVCQDFLRGRCERRSCRYTHILVREIPQVRLQPYGALMEIPRSPPRIANGKSSDQETLQVCKDFLNQMCKRDSCKYAHPNSDTKVIDNRVEVCRDFQRGICKRTVCRFYHRVKQSRVESRSSS